MRDDKVPLLLEANTHDDDSGGDSDAGKTAHPLPRFSLAEVHRHNRVDDCWVVVHGAVYDVQTRSVTCDATSSTPPAPPARSSFSCLPSPFSPTAQARPGHL